MKHILKQDRGEDGKDQDHSGRHEDRSGERTHDHGRLDESRNRVEKLERPSEWPAPGDEEKGDE